MTKTTIWAGLIGLLIGLAVSAYAHGGKGLQTGPLFFLGFGLSVIGGLGAALFIFAMGRPSTVAAGIVVLSLAMLVALVVLPILWPYQKPSGPVPLNGSEYSGPK